MSRKQNEGLTEEKSIIKLKRNYSQEREIRETVTYTEGENEVPEPNTAKESSVNKIHELLENIPLKVEESNCNSVYKFQKMCHHLRNQITLKLQRMSYMPKIEKLKISQQSIQYKVNLKVYINQFT
jgi:hypothetical protein